MPSVKNSTLSDSYYMQKALQQARRAFLLGDIPVGAVIVWQDQVISRGYNQRELKQDPAAHAELIAIKKAAKKLKSWRLLDCTLYVTLEPCAMCAGAIVLARLPRVVFAASDPKTGACGSIMNILQEKKLNHQPEITSGILETESSQLLKEFFKKLRQSKQ